MQSQRNIKTNMRLLLSARCTTYNFLKFFTDDYIALDL